MAEKKTSPAHATLLIRKHETAAAMSFRFQDKKSSAALERAAVTLFSAMVGRTPTAEEVKLLTGDLEDSGRRAPVEDG